MARKVLEVIKHHVCSYRYCACWLQLLLLSIVMCGKAWDPQWVMPTNRLALRDKVVEMFTHAYTSYMDHAYPADELMPIACKGRIRGVTAPRGDVDDSLGNFSLTLIDTLDTLAVLGMYDEFEEAIRNVEKDVRFDANLVVSVFETNIRVLGGLLGAHAAALEIQSKHDRMKWYNNSLLHMAKEVGDRLLPAFNTSTGIPMARINLATGGVHKLRDKDTCTACAGTMILEMAALSRFTGDPIYEQKARKAMDFLWSRRQRSSDLMGTVLRVKNGEWIRKESGIGAGIDSYYEYLLKAYIAFADEEYLERFSAHYSAIKQYIKQGPLLLDVHMHKPTVTAKSFMDALGAFWPGLQVLKGDLQPAIENHELLYQVFLKHKFLPEAFTTTFDIYWGQYPLRPEFAESTYLLYKATGDPYYLEVGKTIVENLEKHARVKCGYAGIKDVRTFKHEDRMDSYFLAEMFKYLYLLFTPDRDVSFLPTTKSNHPGINIENYLLTTEAHLIPLYLTKMGNENCTNGQWRATVNAEGNTERFCPNNKYVRPDDLRPIRAIRKKVKNFFRGIRPQEESCKRTSPFDKEKPPWTGPRQLQATEFDPSNKQHIDILQLMGITAVVLKDGNIQLVQHPNKATTSRNAKEGELFMHDILELNAKRSVEIETKPVLVQLLSQPYLGAVVLKGGPAQFGPNLETTDPVSGVVTYSDPFNACTEINNPQEVKGRIAIAQRGGCMFVEKTKNLEKAGAVGTIIFDNNPDTQFGPGPTFAMAGDGSTETSIPGIFLFAKEANVLRNTIGEFQTEGRPPLEVLIGAEPKSLHEVILEHQVKKGMRVKVVKEEDSVKDQESSEGSSNSQSDFETRLELNPNLVVDTTGIRMPKLKDPESGGERTKNSDEKVDSEDLKSAQDRTNFSEPKDEL